MNEGGQSSTGQLLDFMVETHPAFGKLEQLAKEKGLHHFALLAELLQTIAQEQKAPFLTWLTRNIFLYPDLHGRMILLNGEAFAYPSCRQQKSFGRL